MQSDARIVIAEVRRRKTIVNAELIKLGLDRPDRAARLNKMAIDQLNKLSEDDINQRLLGGSDTPQLPE